MRIQHNIAALNSHRNLGINNNATSKNLEKLSSGYRINRAGDDAAGLAISEKMRGQIRGLAMAEQNTSMGINLIQTAEGGLNETHAILQRMRELAVQSSNGTFQDSDRAQLTHEYDALKSEIDRIANSTQYNGIDLLNGNLGDGTFAKLSNNPKSVMKSAQLTGASTLAAGDVVDVELSTYVAGTPAEKGVQAFTIANTATAYVSGDTIGFTFGGNTYTTDALAGGETAAQIAAAMAEAIKSDTTAPYSGLSFTVEAVGEKLIFATKVAGENLTFDGYSAISPISVTGTGSAPTAVLDNNLSKPSADAVDPTVSISIGGAAASVSYDATTDTFTAIGTNGLAVTIDGSKLADAKTGTMKAQVTVMDGKALTFQIGANGVSDQQVTLNVDNMDSRSIGKTTDETSFIMEAGSSIYDSKISDIDSANEAIEIIDGATEMVSAQRAKLGALQNRLEHTLNNLGVTKENLTASESTIRDVDMASEMMEYTKNNILIQASQAMLAQANQLPQGVLQLLR